MNEWTVVGVLVTIVGLFAAVGKPILNLNSNIVKLTATVQALESKMKESDESNTKTHTRIFDKLEEHEKALEGHETRIHDLEHDH